MKKILFVMVALVAMAFTMTTTSCKKGSANDSVKNDSTAVVDSDSVKGDSAVIKAATDSVAK